jgi:hypothetical protein
LPEPSDPVEELSVRFGFDKSAGAMPDTESSPGDSVAIAKLRELDTVELEDGAIDLSAFLDVSDLTDELAAEKKKWREASEELAARMISLARNARKMTLGEAREEWIRIQNEHHERVFRNVEIEHYKSQIAGTGEVGDWSDVEGRFEAWSELSLRTYLAMHVTHEHWGSAAQTAWRLGGDGPQQDPGWYDQETFYWRRAGWRGRVTLVARSVMPIVGKVAPRLWRNSDDPVKYKYMLFRSYEPVDLRTLRNPQSESGP